MLRLLYRLCRDESGATAVEYGLIAGLMSVVAIAGMQVAGGHLQAAFEYIGDTLHVITQNSP